MARVRSNLQGQGHKFLRNGSRWRNDCCQVWGLPSGVAIAVRFGPYDSCALALGVL
jgi:hypothetical protein